MYICIYVSIIVATYGSGIHKMTTKLQDAQCKLSRAKNQVTFLKRCIHHNIIPKFLNIRSPVQSKRGENITKLYRKKLLVATKNDTTERYFRQVKLVKQLTSTLKEKLSEEHFSLLIKITDSGREKIFIETRTKLKDKFQKLYE